jgi:hypothetical protein
VVRYGSYRSPARYVSVYAVVPVPAVTVGAYFTPTDPRSSCAGTAPVNTCVCQLRPPSVLAATTGLSVTGSTPGTHR